MNNTHLHKHVNICVRLDPSLLFSMRKLHQHFYNKRSTTRKGSVISSGWCFQNAIQKKTSMPGTKKSMSEDTLKCSTKHLAGVPITTQLGVNMRGILSSSGIITYYQIIDLRRTPLMHKGMRKREVNNLISRTSTLCNSEINDINMQ